jgi:hypothetical protein
MIGGPSRQRRGRDGGGRRSGDTLVHEQGRGRKGGWPMGHPAGWGLASSGEGVSQVGLSWEKKRMKKKTESIRI